MWRALKPTTVCDEHTDFLGAFRSSCTPRRDERERRTKLRGPLSRELAGDQPENWRVTTRELAGRYMFKLGPRRLLVRGPWYAVRSAVFHVMMEVFVTSAASSFLSLWYCTSSLYSGQLLHGNEFAEKDYVFSTFEESHFARLRFDIWETRGGGFNLESRGYGFKVACAVECQRTYGFRALRLRAWLVHHR